VRHKFYEQASSFLLKRGVMPRVAALVPTRMAQGLSGWDDSRPDFLLLLSGEDCSDLSHWWASHLALPRMIGDTCSG
jgi:hypothetical protein